MISINSVTEAAERCTAKVSERETAITSAVSQIEALEVSRATAEAAMQSALDSGNSETYVSKKNEVSNLNDQIAAKKIYLEKLKSHILITQEEYETRVSDILADLRELEESKKADMLALVRQIKAIGDEMGETVANANQVLEDLWGNLYHAPGIGQPEYEADSAHMFSQDACISFALRYVEKATKEIQGVAHFPGIEEFNENFPDDGE